MLVIMKYTFTTSPLPFAPPLSTISFSMASYFFSVPSPSPESSNEGDELVHEITSVDLEAEINETQSTHSGTESDAFSRLIVTQITNAGRLPSYGSEGAAGMDVHAAEEITIPPHQRSKVGTGIAVEWRCEYPAAYYLRVAPRSSLAVRKGIDIGAGVIDSDYRGEISVVVFNHGPDPYTISVGDRIAQLIWTRCDQIDRIEWAADDEELTETARGTNGFGSTGV